MILTQLRAFSGADDSKPDRNKVAYPCLFHIQSLSPDLTGLPYERRNILFLKTTNADMDFRIIGNKGDLYSHRANSQSRVAKENQRGRSHGKGLPCIEFDILWRRRRKFNNKKFL